MIAMDVWKVCMDEGGYKYIATYFFPIGTKPKKVWRWFTKLSSHKIYKMSYIGTQKISGKNVLFIGGHCEWH